MDDPEVIRERMKALADAGVTCAQLGEGLKRAASVLGGVSVRDLRLPGLLPGVRMRRERETSRRG